MEFGQQGLSKQSDMLQNMENLMKDMERVDINLSVESVPDKVILLLGQTKAGKTTLMYYLLGKKLIRWYNEQFGLFQMKPDAKIFDALIGNDYQSTTVYPNIPTELGQDRVLIIDMPGFSDTRCIYRLLNIYIVREVIKKIRSVHVSLVISNETLEAHYLMDIIQRNCLLLNNRIVSTPGCISFILTKIEDKESDLESFKFFLEELKNETDNEQLSEAVKTIINANIYMFENVEPKIEDGVALKAQIIAQNSFFQTDEKPDNLLSESFAGIISGEHNPTQFISFVINLLNGVRETLTLLVRLFTVAVKLHHAGDLALIYSVADEKVLMGDVVDIANQIHAASISSLEVTFDGEVAKGSAVGLLSLLKKFYTAEKDELNLELQSFIIAELDKFIDWSRLFASEQSIVSPQLRKRMHDLFKFCGKVLRTISHIKQPEIMSSFQAFCKNALIIQAIQAYKNINSEGDLVVRIASCEPTAHELSQNEEFGKILNDLMPDFKWGGGQEEIQSRKISVHSKIKHKKMLASLETTKQVDLVAHMQRESAHITINEISKDTIRTIRNMPLESSHLKTILGLINKFKHQFQKSSDRVKVQFGMALFRKAGQLLEKLQLFEEAILFYLAIPSELEAETLIHTALDFNEITQQFIRSILLPYYSKWSPNFTMIEEIYNYLTMNTYDPQQLMDNELQFATILEQMHEINYDALPELKRFQLGLVEDIISEERHHRTRILERAKHNEVRLNRSKLTVMQKDIATLRAINDY